MKHIGNLSPAPGSKHKKKRIGRGEGSGYGGTSTKGHKGQKSRSGVSLGAAFEGGQMPLNRRVPKFGFWNPFRVEYQTLNLGTVQKLAEKYNFKNKIGFDELIDLKIVSSKRRPLKILGDGDYNLGLEISAHKFSKSALEKIETAGGKALVIQWDIPKKPKTVSEIPETPESDETLAEAEPAEAKQTEAPEATQDKFESESSAEIKPDDESSESDQDDEQKSNNEEGAQR